MRRLLITLILAIPAICQQTVDNSTAVRVIPFPVRFTFPGSCQLGEMMTYAMAVPPNNTYGCGSNNNWVLIGGTTSDVPGTSGQFVTTNGTGGFGTSIVGAVVPYPSLVQSAGSDCIFALHTDTITGMSCANTSVDGTTETAFTNGVIIRANTLSNITVTVNSTFLAHTSGGSTPTVTFRLRLGGIGGTSIYQSATIVPVTGASDGVVEYACQITAIGAASSSTPIVVACGPANNFGPATRNMLLSNTTQSIATDVTTDKTLVWTVTYSAATAGNAIGLYSMFNGLK